MARKDYYYQKEAPSINSIVAAASAVVTLEDGRIVLHKRRDNDHWSLLGGGMKYGESISDTIVREVKEECGLDCVINKLVGVYTDPNHVIEYSDGEVRQEFSICFHCNASYGEIKVSNESKEVRAFSIEEIASMNIHPSQRKRIDDYLKEEATAFIR